MNTVETLITDDFQVFIKPVGARCNLRCIYCYYLGKAESNGGGKGESKRFRPDKETVMSDVTLEKCIGQLFAASSGGTVLFTWHGGEPLLAGIDFYKKALSIQKKLAPEGKGFINGMQTNGTLITKEWCEFFAENRFAVGISMDGPEEFHNAMRRGAPGAGDEVQGADVAVRPAPQTPHPAPIPAGSFEKTLNGYRLLRKYGIDTEILCVVNSYNVNYPLVVYDFFKRLEAKYITFLPLVEKSNHRAEKVSEASVPALGFGHFLSAIFDEWVKKDIGVLKIQIFEEALRTAFNQEHSLCIFRERCGGVPVIEHSGVFYPCDHFVEKSRALGNIDEHDLAYYLHHPVQTAFGDAKQHTLPQYCYRCEVKNMCNGECPKNRFITSPDGEQGLNYLCEGYTYFFNRCKPFVDSVSEAWRIANHASTR